MAHIDKFIEVIFKYKADRLVLASNEKVMLMSGSAGRPMTAQPVSLQQVQDLVQEIVPAAQARVTMLGGTSEFEYGAPSGSVHVSVVRDASSLRVQIEPLGVEAVAAVPAFASSTAGAALATPPLQGRVATALAAAPAPARTTKEAAPVSSLGTARRRPKIDALFDKMVQQRCSDLHLSVGSPPLFRKDGEITPLGEQEPLTGDVIRDLIAEFMPGPNNAEFEARHDTDFSYEKDELARFRCNVFLDRRGMGAVFRFIPAKIPSAQELGLSKAILDLCSLPKGLVLVTGPTGSGKSTTLAAMIDHINTTRSDHIITIEDPIEFVHPNRRCLVNQREIGPHTEGFKTALRAALREDPDIVLVGEMRDLETVAIAIETAETGHLVFGTLHTNTAASAVDRMIDQFPTDRQAQVRAMLSESLRGVVAQALVKKKGGGRCAAQEILVVNAAVSNLIREGKTFQIQSIIQTGRGAGMVTMQDALLELVKSGQVEPSDALSKAVNVAEFKAILERNNIKLV